MATTERHYAGLTPGVLREAPDVLERFISEKTAPLARPEAASRKLVKIPPQGIA